MNASVNTTRLVNNVNHKNMIVMWNFLKGYAKDKDLKEEDVNIFYMLELPFPDNYSSVLDYYTDPSQWSPLEIYVQCYLKTKEVSKDPNAFRNCGRSAAKYGFGTWEYMAVAAGGPSRAYNYLPIVIPDWNDTKILELIRPAKYYRSIKKVRVDVKYQFHPHINPCDDYCSDPHILGLFEAIPISWSLPMGEVQQPMVQYDPIKLFQGRFFSHLDLQPFFEGPEIYLKDPNKNEVVMVGRRVILQPSDVGGKELFIGKYKTLTGTVDDKDVVGTLMQKTIEVYGEPVCEEGVIMEAPYHIINMTCEEFVIKRIYLNLRSFLVGTKDVLKELDDRVKEQRQEIEQKNVLIKELDSYKEHLEEMVEQKTKELIVADRLAAVGRLAAQISHETKTPLQATRDELEMLRDEYLYLVFQFQDVDKLGLDEPLKTELYDVMRKTIARSAEVEYRNRSTIESLGESLYENLKGKYKRVTVEACEDLAAMGYDSAVSELDRLLQVDNPSEITGILRRVFNVGFAIHNGIRASDRQMRIINALLEHSHVDRREIEAVDIKEKISATLTLYDKAMRDLGIEVETAFDQSLGPVECNVVRMNDVYRNIIENALDALRESEGERTLRIKTMREDGCAIVEVTDSGPGIPSENIDKIFEPMYTTKKVGEGTGLGLNIVYNTMKEHKGDVQCSSKPGETTFRLRMPVVYKGKV